MKIGIVGLGSIGKRHIENINRSCDSEITLLRSIGKGNPYGLKEVFDAELFFSIGFDLVIICNPTAYHYQALQPAIEAGFNILAEKPLVNTAREAEDLRRDLGTYGAIGKVALQMRYHPCIRKVKEMLEDNSLGRIFSSRFHVGQYLPDWRPGTNHLESYSALSSQGGGVVLDLIHEIDLAEYLLGRPAGDIFSLVGRTGDVTADSEDLAEILYATDENGMVSVHLDYLSRPYYRGFTLVSERGNLHCDLFRATLVLEGPGNRLLKEIRVDGFEKNTMYLELIRDYLHAVESGNAGLSRLPDLTESLDAMQTAFTVKNRFNGQAAGE